MFGEREKKYEYLNGNDLTTAGYKELTPAEPYYFFVPKDFNVQADYNKGIKIDELFKLNKAGIATGRDDLFIDMDKETLIRKLHEVFECNDILTSKYKLKVTDTYKLCTTIKTAKYSEEYFRNLLYRPFDTRYVYYDTRLLQRARYDVMKQFFNHNVGLIFSRMVLGNYEWNDVFITKDITEKGIMAMRVSNTAPIFPLYIYEDDSNQTSFFDQSRKPNLNMDIVRELEQKLGLTFTPEKEDTTGTFAPIDILDYIYGVLHSNKYRNKYKEFLKIDFPRIPYPENAEYFFQVAQLGKQLREIHLLESPVVNEFVTSYPVGGDNEVVKPEYKDNKVYINKTQYFDNVPEIAWNFYIGGYQPAQKWLKDRKGRILSYEDVMHYQKIIKALSATHTLMQQIDEIIEV